MSNIRADLTAETVQLVNTAIKGNYPSDAEFCRDNGFNHTIWRQHKGGHAPMSLEAMDKYLRAIGYELMIVSTE